MRVEGDVNNGGDQTDVPLSEVPLPTGGDVPKG